MPLIIAYNGKYLKNTIVFFVHLCTAWAPVTLSVRGRNEAAHLVSANTSTGVYDTTAFSVCTARGRGATQSPTEY